MIWQWFNLSESGPFPGVVGGPVELFGEPFWCAWSQTLRRRWRVQGMRALNSGTAIVEIARAFPGAEVSNRNPRWKRTVARA